jgi:uncharacterized repeat protein (TIGR03806 family)
MNQRWLIVWLSLLFSACDAEPSSTPIFIDDGNPPFLSAWGMMHVDGSRLTLSDGVEPYDLSTPLFTDFAHKQRTIWMPAGTTAIYREGEPLDFPVGTVITKTFYYPRTGARDEISADRSRVQGWQADGLELDQIRLMETRILVHRETGWTALPYVWNEAQTDARLARAGYVETLDLTHINGDRESFSYVVPNSNQCAGCHAVDNTTRAIQPIGPAARYLNSDFDYASGTANQLAHLHSAGYLDHRPEAGDGPLAVDYLDTDLSLESRARAYLDINCAHCHNSAGAADTSGLLLDHETRAGPQLGLCKLPIAAGGGTGGRRYDIAPGQADESILLYRMETTDPASLMPELGRSTVDVEGVALIRDWINAITPDCGEN